MNQNFSKKNNTQSNSKTKGALILLLLSSVLVTTVSTQALDWWPFGKKNEKSSAPVQMDTTIINRSNSASNGSVITSFAPTVKKAAPSVVSIFTTKKIKLAERTNPLMNDPFFRYFFGGPRGGGQDRQYFGEEEDEPTQKRPNSKKNNSEKFRKEPGGLGSGVIITSDGYIMTNNHVVDGADEIKITLADGKKEYPAKLIGKDPMTDVAVIKVDAKDLPAITITDSDLVEVGDLCLAIGNPFGIGQTATQGMIGGLGRHVNASAESRNMISNFIQTDAAINPGNSGGALVDIQGRLIGINTMILSPSGANAGIGFAIPINLAKSIMEQLLRGGKVTRGYLGVSIQPMTDELAEEFKLKSKNGALIGGVSKKGPADRAGIQAGDVITEINGKTVTDPDSLRLMITQIKPGSDVKVKIIRKGALQELTAKLDTLPGEEELAKNSSETGDDVKPLEVPFGLVLGSLKDEQRREQGAPRSLEGVVIKDIKGGSIAEDVGLEPGDIIQSINQQPVSDVKDAQALLKKSKGKKAVLLVWRKGMSQFVVLND